jgi:small-conductance mechanosensitive channel
MFSNQPQWIEYSVVTLCILAAAFIIHRLLRLLLSRFLKKSSDDLRVDPTNYTFLKNGLGLIILTLTIITILYSIPEFKQVGITLFAGAGIFAAILGFASQAAFSNIISGIFIVIFKPFRVGDIVSVEARYSGIIEDITLRHVVIKDFESRRYVIPNSVISNDVIHNSSIYDEKTANFLIIGISYDSDLDKAIEIIREEALKHPNIIDNRTEQEIQEGLPIVVVRVIKLNDSSVDLRATCWTETFVKGFELKTDLYRIIKLRFDKEGIEIPFPHRTIVQKSDGKVR